MGDPSCPNCMGGGFDCQPFKLKDGSCVSIDFPCTCTLYVAPKGAIIEGSANILKKLWRK